jgi:hypothetical protein
VTMDRETGPVAVAVAVAAPCGNVRIHSSAGILVVTLAQLLIPLRYVPDISLIPMDLVAAQVRLTVPPVRRVYCRGLTGFFTVKLSVILIRKR